MLIEEKNRAPNCLIVSKLNDVSSSVFGEIFNVSHIVERCCKTSIGEIQAVVNDAVLPQQVVKLR